MLYYVFIESFILFILFYYEYIFKYINISTLANCVLFAFLFHLLDHIWVTIMSIYVCYISKLLTGLKIVIAIWFRHFATRFPSRWRSPVQCGQLQSQRFIFRVHQFRFLLVNKQIGL